MKIRDWFKEFTSDLNQPAFKAVVFAALTIGTAVSYWVAMQVRVWTGYCELEAGKLFAICRGDLQEEAFWAWLAFLAAGWGVTFLDYRTKRQTSYQNGAPAKDPEPPPPAEQGG